MTYFIIIIFYNIAVFYCIFDQIIAIFPPIFFFQSIKKKSYQSQTFEW